MTRALPNPEQPPIITGERSDVYLGRLENGIFTFPVRPAYRHDPSPGNASLGDAIEAFAATPRTAFDKVGMVAIGVAIALIMAWTTLSILRAVA